MNTEPFGTTIFCDDIRHEVGGKMTLVGCYSSELNFNGPAPGLLPTFAALIKVRIPTSITFESIKIRVLKKEGSEETEIWANEAVLEEDQRKKILEDVNSEEDNSSIVSMNVFCKLDQLTIKESGTIVARAYLDDGDEIRLGALKVGFKSENAS